MKALFLLASLSVPLLALADEPEPCATGRFSDVGWTTYRALSSGKEPDVFLGNWMPTTDSDIKPYRDAGSVEVVRANLNGAKYTLAVPNYVYGAGPHDFADIARFKGQLSRDGQERLQLATGWLQRA